MKKLDKLILDAFISPFFLTFLVVVFILLNIQMLRYFDVLMGKGLEWSVIGQFIFYFAVVTTPTALPLSILLSSLIAFGNLGEHFELTAIKSAGISLLRVLRPLFILVLVLTGVAFYANNTLVPYAALEAYSLLYDIKQKKPALDLREGVFYDDIRNISIKVDKKYPDGITLKEVVIYDHRSSDGNREVTVADSGRMAVILNSRYLKLELFNGYNYADGMGTDQKKTERQMNGNVSLSRRKFLKSQLVFDLSSIQFERTEKSLFQSNRMMRNMNELNREIDSARRKISDLRISYDQIAFRYFRKSESTVSNRKQSIEKMNERDTLQSTLLNNHLDAVRNVILSSIVKTETDKTMLREATNSARQVLQQLQHAKTSTEDHEKQITDFTIQWHKILASSVACVAMFLIGAPLGAIIKKGGLGMPFLVSILFFIIYYVLTMQGEKLAKQEVINVVSGVWIADALLIFIGIIFLYQARSDARLFEADFYRVMSNKFKINFRFRF